MTSANLFCVDLILRHLKRTGFFLLSI